MKTLSLITLLATVTLLATSPALAVKEGGGGAGVHRNGLVLTIGGAQIPLHPALALTDIPGLQTAIAGVQSLKLSKIGIVLNGSSYDTDVRETLTIALRPTLTKRRYFSINESEVAPKLLSKLRNEYGEVSKRYGIKGKDQVRLFAITQGDETFLLPDFFNIRDRLTLQIDPKGQAAVLFHETLRYLIPEIKTEDVVALEVAFEKYLKKTNDVAIYYELFRNLKAPEEVLASAYYRYDLKAGTINDLINDEGDFDWTHFDAPTNNLSPLIPTLKNCQNWGSCKNISDLILTHQRSLFLSWIVGTDSRPYFEPSPALEVKYYRLAGAQMSLAKEYFDNFPKEARWVQVDDPDNFMNSRRPFPAPTTQVACGNTDLSKLESSVPLPWQSDPNLNCDEKNQVTSQNTRSVKLIFGYHFTQRPRNRGEGTPLDEAIVDAIVEGN